MVYVSSSCVRSKSLKESVEILLKAGFRYIELSGGSVYEEHLLETLQELQAKHHLRFSCHNYFPPPKQDFVINVASLDSEIFEKSVQHLLLALEYSYHLGAGHFGFHAGFFLPLVPHELGSTSSGAKHRIWDRQECIEQFIRGYRIIEKKASELGIRLFIENNVLSFQNAQKYGTKRISMLLDFEDFIELKGLLDCSLLLDVGHLKVSAKSLGLDYCKQLESCLKVADYIHLSDNDALSDENKPIVAESDFLPLLQATHHKHKIYTLEVYTGLSDVKRSYELLCECLGI